LHDTAASAGKTEHDMWVGESNADDLFAEYIARYQAGELVELREYTERHPELADKLRELEAEWWRVARILRRAAQGHSLAEQVATQYGSDADPHIELERESDGTGEAALRAVIASIRGRVGANERYRAKDKIGEGGMGIVMRVWDVELKRSVAMKVIKKANERVGWPGFEGVTSPVVSRFIEEAQITSQLDHPGIVPVHEIGINETGMLYFTMRLVRGQSLKEIFESERRELDGWNRTRLLGVLLKACEALAYAHDKGVVHRDLKPSNIMVGRFGEVYVMDWGLARPLHAPDLHVLDFGLEQGPASTQIRSDARGSDSSPGVTHAGDVLGTAEYMPPEQARSALSQIGKHSDVYSMGAVLYHLLCGHSPYQGGERRLNRHEVLARLLEGPPRPIEELAIDAPPELLAICRKAMLRETHQRYATMLEFAEDLRAFLEHRVVRAYSTGTWAELSNWIARNRALAATAAIAAAVIVAGTTFFLVQLGHEVDQKQAAFDALEKSTRERDRTNHRLQARELITRADALFPTTPASVPQMRQWLAEVGVLLEAARVHEPSRPLVAAGDALAGQFRQLFAAIDDLRATRGDVEQRLQRATSLEHRSLVEHAADWSQAIERIEESAQYRDVNGDGMSILPQLGLVPLGPSPKSELEEFWVVDSGAAPQTRDDRSGEWRIDTTTGIVLVLVPGERDFTMGSSDPANGSDGQTCSVELHPFFVGKHEVTQGQWFAAMHDRPAYRSIDRPRTAPTDPYGAPLQFDDRYPVEEIDWFDAQRFARRFDLRLAFEAQWEFASRGGTTGDFWTGSDPERVLRRENIQDVIDASRQLPLDTFAYTAPVGSLAHNPFGLADVLGNVSEWCRDVFHRELGPARTGRGDGARDDFEREDGDSDPLGERILRGGSYTLPPLDCVVAGRWPMRVHGSNAATGLRVVRPLWPCPWCEAGAPPHK
jgi:serine/threonine protein kinase/formylglycine-generating enzyme required for sulfatase activity